MNDTPDTSDAAQKSKAVEAIDTRLVRRLADILKATDLTTIEVEHNGLRIRVAREIVVQQTIAAPLAASAAPAPAAAPAAAPSATAEASAPAAPVRTGDMVKSPMVGTAYLQAEPGAPPFAAVGSQIKVGDTLLIIEAMKVMNPIKASKGGTLTQVLVSDGQPVEYGEPLMIVE
jgi:acetyl-CoA carboxylase biotin carboxyl carrier protein